MKAASLHFRGVFIQELDEVLTTSRFIIEQFDYSLSISVRNTELIRASR